LSKEFGPETRQKIVREGSGVDLDDAVEVGWRGRAHGS
jgi:hypothetical protein